jgi:hypothetical protein
MKHMRELSLGRGLASSLLLLLLGACSDPKTMPASMTGSFVRSEDAFFGPKLAQLEVTATGITARSAGSGMEMGGTPFNAHARHTDTAVTSVLFKSVSCNATTCRFVGVDGCEGTLSRDGAGDVTIVSAASCASLAGKWLGPQSASKTPLPG